MASTYTVNLGIEKIGTGEQSGTWGNTTNTNFDLIDQAVNGAVTVTLASAGTSGSPNTLAITDGASSDGRNKFIEFADGADLGATAYIQLTPNDAEKIVHMRNSLSGGRSVIVFQGTYNASNDFEIPNGKDVVLKFDGAGASATVTDVFEDLQATAITTPSLTATNLTATGTTTLAGVTADTISLGDYTDALTLGASNDLSLYHDGTNSQIKSDTGSLIIRTDAFRVLNNANSEQILHGDANGAVTAYYDNAVKLATTATGIDVTGAVTADGLTTDGIPTSLDENRLVFNEAPATGSLGSRIVWRNPSTGYDYASVGFTNEASGSAGGLRFKTASSVFSDSDTLRAAIASNGDISFYEDTGTTPKFFWDASAESLGIGTTTTAISSKLQVASTTTALDSGGTIFASTTDSPAADIGGQVMMGGYYTGTSVAAFGGMAAKKSNATDGNYDGYLQFLTSTHPTGNTEKMRIDASGNVGIGTTTPESALDIGSGIFTQREGSVRNNVSSTSTGLEFTVNAGSLNVSRSFVFKGSTSGGSVAERMRIDSSGQVGIGTTSPNYNLTSYKAGANANYLQVANGSTGPNSANGTLFGVDASGNGVVNVQGAFDYITSVGNAERMRITSAGNVGIGTSSPAYNLDVSKGSAGTAARFTASTDNGRGLSFISSDNGIFLGAIWTRDVASGSGIHAWSINSSEKMRIDSSGNVGIGTSSPESRLTVLQSALDGNAILLPMAGSAVAESYSSIRGKYGVGNDFCQSEVRFGVENTGSGTGFLAFSTGTNSSTERMRITSAGNVGIGTSSPAYLLHVNGGNQFNTGWIRANTGTAANPNFTVDGGAGLFKPTSNEVAFSTASTERMRIDSSGNVGIGSTDAASYGKFLVNGTGNLINANASSGAATFQLYEAGAGRFGITTLNGSAGAAFTTAGTERMRIDSSGNVGIGTTGPASRLHVTGAATGVTVEGTTRADLFLIDSGAPTDQKRKTIRSFDGDLIFGTENDAINDFAEAMRLDSSGNLLVGTTDSIVYNEGSTGNSGVVISSDNYYSAARKNGPTLFLNRQASDGAIAQFYKDGVIVGSIGTLSNIYTYIGTDDTTLLFAGNLDAVLPRGTDGAQRDGAINLGTGSNRFKDLYLSGGVYLGGTGAANLLDDYEEGTFTPTLEGGGAAGTYELASAIGKYTKIGRQVTIDVSITLAAAITGGGSGYAKIGNLPFTYDASESLGAYDAVFLAGVAFNASATQIVVGRASSGDSSILALYEILQNSTSDTVSISDFSANDNVAFTLTYNAL